jgi:hypothetical protein
MRSGAFQMGALLAALIMGTFVTLEGGHIAEEMGLVEGDVVLVFVVPLPENEQRIRSAVAPDRVVWQGEQGLALVGGRVVTPSLDQAGDVIERAGWVDRPVQVVTLEADMGEASADEGDRGSPASREERLARLRELVHKPMLSRGEQMFVLQAMNDGLQI